MPRIRCHYDDCVFLEEGYCGAAAIELDPEMGCQTYSRADDAAAEDEEDWEEDSLDEEEWDDEDEDLYEDEEEDDWDEEEEDEY
jgi:hypothetical protein